MRIGEALGLRHDDLAAAEREVRITARINDNGARAKAGLGLNTAIYQALTYVGYLAPLPIVLLPDGSISRSSFAALAIAAAMMAATISAQIRKVTPCQSRVSPASPPNSVSPTCAPSPDAPRRR
jgi:hypothetical protein